MLWGSEEEAKIVETHPVLPKTLHRSFILPSVLSTNFYKPGIVPVRVWETLGMSAPSSEAVCGTHPAYRININSFPGRQGLP